MAPVPQSFARLEIHVLADRKLAKMGDVLILAVVKIVDLAPNATLTPNLAFANKDL